MAPYDRPNLILYIVAQSMPLEKQQQLVGLFWTLALAVILLFLFVGVMMALARVIRRRMRLEEQENKRKRQQSVDPWGEAARRLDPNKSDIKQWLDDDQTDDSADWDPQQDSDDTPPR